MTEAPLLRTHADEISPATGELILAGYFAYEYSDAYPGESAINWQYGVVHALGAGEQELRAYDGPPAIMYTRLTVPGGRIIKPEETWISERVGGILLSPEMIRRRGLFDPRHVQKLLDEHDSGFADHAALLWGLVALELWQRHYLDPSPRASTTTKPVAAACG